MARFPSPRTHKAAPGPHGYPVLGVLPQAWHNPLQFFLEAARRYGDVVALGLGSHRVYLLNHPAYIQYVLQDNHLNYHKGTSIASIKPLFGTGLTTSEGEIWRRQRRLLQPAFQHRRIAARRRCQQETGDLLSLLLHTRHAETGKGMSDMQLRDEVMTIFVAGHETTAAALAWTWYLLAKHPDVHRRLQAERTAVLGGRTPTAQDLHIPLARPAIARHEASPAFPADGDCG